MPDGTEHRQRRKAPVASKSEAQRWGKHRASLWYDELRKPKPTPALEEEVPTLTQFASRFVEGHAVANRHKPAGIEHKRTILRWHLIPTLGYRKLNDITSEDVDRLKYSLRGKSVKTANNVLTVLNTLLKKAVEWKVIGRLPCDVRLLKPTPGSVDFFEFDEFDRLVTAAEAVGWCAHLIVLLAGEAGLRSGEMRALRQSDANLEKRQLRVERSEWRGQVCSTKGGRIRYVPMTVTLAEALRRYRHLRAPLVLCRDDGRPLTEGDVRAYVDRAARRAQLREKGPHMLRHTFCSHLAMNGVPVRAIQELAGHRNLSTTQRYMHNRPKAIEEAIRTLDQRRGARVFGDIVETPIVADRKVNG